MQKIIAGFPEGLATGRAFLNREVERRLLLSRIKANRHTVLIAPRRYGKTSLVHKVAKESKLPYRCIDLFASYSEEYVCEQIVNKVNHMVFELLPLHKKATTTLLKIFQSMQPEIVLGGFGQRLVLKLSNQPLQDITELLLKLDETAQHFNKRAVLFMDEFQQISQLKNYHGIEASIRHAVERSKNIAYVFSGSNRYLLQQMFGDQSRPFYRLCQTITLERMHKPVYEKYFQKMAKQRWNKTLSVEVIEEIFKQTERHPFYINLLCQQLWDQEKLPTVKQVNTVWESYVRNQRQIISHDVSRLSANQRKLLRAIAEKSPKEIQSVEFTSPLNISASSAQQALQVLVRQDMVYRDGNNLFQLIDPAMKYYLNVILWE